MYRQRKYGVKSPASIRDNRPLPLSVFARYHMFATRAANTHATHCVIANGLCNSLSKVVSSTLLYLPLASLTSALHNEAPFLVAPLKTGTNDGCVPRHIHRTASALRHANPTLTQSATIRHRGDLYVHARHHEVSEVPHAPIKHHLTTEIASPSNTRIGIPTGTVSS